MIQIEILGILKQQTGKGLLQIDPSVQGSAGELTLGEVLNIVANSNPGFNQIFDTESNQLQKNIVVSIGNQRFTRMLEAVVPNNALVVILSTDAGG